MNPFAPTMSDGMPLIPPPEGDPQICATTTPGRGVPASPPASCVAASAPPSLVHAAAFPIVPPAEVFLQPDVEADEEITATHLSDPKLGSPAPTVAPRDRNDCPAVSANYCLERQLHRQVEVGSDQ